MPQSDVKTRKFLAAHKKPISAALYVLIVGLMVVPVLAVTMSHAKMQDTWTAIMRVSGLWAFTLIFFNLVTGPLSRYFYAVFKPKRVQAFHIATGASGFALAVMHGTIVFVMAHYRDHPAIWLIGPIALGLMIVTMAVAANRKRLPQYWRRIHQLNYVIFAALYIKVMWIGSNVTAPTAAGNAMKALLSLELLAVALATYLRVRTRVRVSSKAPVEVEEE